MNHPKLDEAREWANRGEHLVGVIHPDAKAAIEIIQSLPDQWVDAEKLERIIAGMDCCLTQGSETNFSDGFKEATTTWRDALKALIPPNLPTLADMTEEERKACQWMQCKVTYSDQIHVIARPELKVSALWREDGYVIQRSNDMITPLPGPKLQWPGGVVDCETVDEEKVREIAGEVAEWSKNLNRRLEPEDSGHQQTNSSETPNSSPQPKMGEWWQVEEERNGKGVGKLLEDAGDYPWLIYLNDGTHDFFKRGSVTPITRMVPEIPAAPDEKTSPNQAVAKDVCNSPRPEEVSADELWMVERDGNEWIGKRNRGGASNADTYPWRIASVNGEGIDIVADSEITLIHKLVPETHTLPKGMRLADERTLGRVMVTTEFNEDGICEIVYWNNALGRNCPGFAAENDITFLDGNQ